LPVAAVSASEHSIAAIVRIATFNCSLNRGAEGALQRDLSTPDSAQARAVAEIIQRVRPDILLLQEFDFDAGGAALASFQTNYLAHAQNGAQPIQYAHSFISESTTGQPSAFDLNIDGKV
jgi:3-phytase